MNTILLDLLKLQALEFRETTEKNIDTQVAELRDRLPATILGHYDRLRVRGKKGVAIVRNQVCSGCHMRVPIGQITELMRGEDLQLCESCGRYLHLPEPTEADLQAQPPASKSPAKAPAKPRKRRALASAV